MQMSLDLQAALLAKAVYNQIVIDKGFYAADTTYNIFGNLYERLDPMEKDDLWSIEDLLSSTSYIAL